jgi:hypothetical protein
MGWERTGIWMTSSELIIGNRIVYNYDPSKHGYDGPTPYNLGMASTKFRALDWVKIW